MSDEIISQTSAMSAHLNPFFFWKSFQTELLVLLVLGLEQTTLATFY